MNNASHGPARVWIAIAATIGLTLSATSDLSAQEKHKYYFKSVPGIAKYTQQHLIDVGDVPGHQIRIYELHTKYAAEAPAYDGVKVVEAWTRASSDYTNGSGRGNGYGIARLANGDNVFSVLDLVSQTTVAADGSRKTAFTTVTRLTGGTGKFKGIRGTLNGTGATDFKTGTSDTVTAGEYWIEK